MTVVSSPGASEGAGEAPRQRVLGYDVLRVIAAVTVVAIHVLAAHLSQRAFQPDPDRARVASHALHYAVPLFTFLSGALSWGMPWRAGPGAFRAFVRRRLKVIAVPYLFWSAVYIALLAALGAVAWPDGAVATARLVAIWLINGTATYHLYYLPLVLVLYLFTPIAARVFPRAPELGLAAAIAVRVLAADPLLAVVARLPYHNAYAPLAGKVLEFLPFMALGAWFAVRRVRIAPALQALALPLLGAGLWLSVGISLGALSFGDVRLTYLAHVAQISAVVLGLTGLAFAIASPRLIAEGGTAAKRLVALASWTFGVYLAHPFVIVWARRAAGLLPLEQPYDSAAFMAVLFAVVLAVSFGLAALLKRGKRTRVLV